jgi:hypothetical protein
MDEVADRVAKQTTEYGDSIRKLIQAAAEVDHKEALVKFGELEVDRDSARGQVELLTQEVTRLEGECDQLKLKVTNMKEHHKQEVSQLNTKLIAKDAIMQLNMGRLKTHFAKMAESSHQTLQAIESSHRQPSGEDGDEMNTDKPGNDNDGDNGNSDKNDSGRQNGDKQTEDRSSGSEQGQYKQQESEQDKDKQDNDEQHDDELKEGEEIIEVRSTNTNASTVSYAGTLKATSNSPPSPELRTGDKRRLKHTTKVATGHIAKYRSSRAWTPRR